MCSQHKIRHKQGHGSIRQHSTFSVHGGSIKSSIYVKFIAARYQPVLLRLVDYHANLSVSLCEL